ncbi:mitochondrial 8-oxoguanine DNA glycosylase family protein [Andalucia godoyi]|uniref:Mitochondrial 8-oxoguanine DNA glycosylase family protein n=1 Tax=Andalucia godoyi TaxID=505711 RepID=A0A8K0F1V6_ANDGO|nr:mitochondrial 8-oxoguanine DNA glycosylase family protein [Andalucia godoyi]|eukprot:ANDGO_04670.mRNA.1 mitochondrial 8-oxoguanine DNA glycosylase family protein
MSLMAEVMMKASKRFLLHSVAARPSLWTPLNVDARELRLESTLFGGQCFRWKRTAHPSIYVGWVLDQMIALEETGSNVYFCAISPGDRAMQSQLPSLPSPPSPPTRSPTAEATARLLRAYFQLSFPVQKLDAMFCDRDPKYFSSVSSRFSGTRLLDQDPFECLVSFICSANNNITRIVQMIEKLCVELGELRAEVAVAIGGGGDGGGGGANVGDADASVVKLYSFPSIEALRQCSEQNFRSWGMGYRAKSIKVTIDMLCDNNFLLFRQLYAFKDPSSLMVSSFSNVLRRQFPLANDEKSEFLTSFTETQSRVGLNAMSSALLENQDSERVADIDAQDNAVLDFLMQFRGVGLKVASCAALFSLHRHSVVPVDTHIWQVSTANYVTSLRNKTCNEKTVRVVQSAWRRVFGPMAGWSQMILFANRLKIFNSRSAEPLSMSAADGNVAASTPVPARKRSRIVEPPI